MTTRDLKNNIDVLTSLDPKAYTSSTNGASADLRGFESAVVAFVVGTVTDGTHTPKVQEAPDDGSGSPGTFTDVAAADLQGTFANLADDTNQRVGYIGGQRHLRAVLTVSGASTGAEVAAVVIRGNADQRPVS